MQVSGHQLVTIPVPASMYQTVVANIQSGTEPGHVQVVGTPIQLVTAGGRGTPIQLAGVQGGGQGVVMKQEPGETGSSQGLTITPVSLASHSQHVSVLQMGEVATVTYIP